MDKTVRLWDLETKTCLKLFAHNLLVYNSILCMMNTSSVGHLMPRSGYGAYQVDESLTGLISMRWSMLLALLLMARKKEPKPEEADDASGNQSNGNGVTNGTSSIANGGRKRELAVYEQYRNQGSNGTQSIGGSAKGVNDTVQKPLLPTFEDVETRNLAESLCSGYGPCAAVLVLVLQ